MGLGFTIYWAMSGNGVRTGMPRTLTRFTPVVTLYMTARPAQDGLPAAAAGAANPGVLEVRIGTFFCPRPETPIWGFGLSGLNNSILFSIQGKYKKGL